MKMECPNQLHFNMYCPFALNSSKSADHQNKKDNLLLLRSICKKRLNTSRY